MSTTTYSRRLLKMKMHKNMKRLQQHRESMTVALDVTTKDLQTHTYKTDRVKEYSDIPGPKSYPIIGGLYHYLPGGRFHKKQYMEVHKACIRDYGNMYKEAVIPGWDMLHICDPGVMEDVFRQNNEQPVREAFFMLGHFNKKYNNNVQGLLTSHGNNWETIRKNVQKKMLKPRAVSSYLAEQSIVADELWNHVNSLLNDDKEMKDIRPELDKYAAECVGVVCFNTRLGAFQDHSTGSDAQRFIKAVSDIMEVSHKEFKQLPWYRLFKSPSFTKLIKAQTFIRELATKYSHIALKKFEKSDSFDGEHGDLIPYLMSKTSLTEEQVMTVVCEFIFAGVDTTSHHLSFVLYHLGKNPHVQDKLFSEISSIVPENEPVSDAHIGQMSYLKAVTKETHRLLPVAPGNIRTLKKDMVISGYKVPAGVQVAMHNDWTCKQEEYFKDALTFKPERWLRENRPTNKVHPFALVPFGFGVRACIGRRFAEQESHIAIIKLLQRFRIEYTGEEIKIDCTITNTPTNNMSFRFVER